MTTRAESYLKGIFLRFSEYAGNARRGGRVGGGVGEAVARKVEAANEGTERERYIAE